MVGLMINYFDLKEIPLLFFLLLSVIDARIEEFLVQRRDDGTEEFKETRQRNYGKMMFSHTQILNG